jgi:hypothetical protein
MLSAPSEKPVSTSSARSISREFASVPAAPVPSTNM